MYACMCGHENSWRACRSLGRKGVKGLPEWGTKGRFHPARAARGWRGVLPARSDTEVRCGWGWKGQSQAVARLVRASTRSQQPTVLKLMRGEPPSRHASPGIPHPNSLLHPSPSPGPPWTACSRKEGSQMKWGCFINQKAWELWNQAERWLREVLSRWKGGGRLSTEQLVAVIWKGKTIHVVYAPLVD